MSSLPPQIAHEFISSARLSPYLQESSSGKHEEALALYQWATELSGAFHATLSFVEIALRNSVDIQLKRWNALEFSSTGLPGSPNWTDRGQARTELKNIAGSAINTARKYAKEALARKNSIQRSRPTHDDVISQFTFGNLTSFFIIPSGDEESLSGDREYLWDACLKDAFPNLGAPNDPELRRKLCGSLNHLRRLRNKVAHHDSLLHVDVRAEISSINSVLGKMHPGLPSFAMEKSQLRRLRREDPRRRNI